MCAQEAGWWTEFFVDFRPMFNLLDLKTTNNQAKYLIKKLGLEPGKSFLDCPAGIGRLSFPIARKGVRVTCVDLTKSYLDEIKLKAKRANLKIQTVHSDMRRINFDSQFDAAGNLGTSIGYFPREADNFLVLKKLFKALKPGNKFALHVTNRDWIMANFQRRDWVRLGNNVLLTEDRIFDFRTSVIRSTWIFHKDRKQKSYEVSLRLYSFHEMNELLKKVGFINIEGFGSVKGEPVSLRSNAMWIFGTKPGKR